MISTNRGESHLLSIIRSHESVCWYPSAGSDFRALLYLSKPFYEKHEELSSEQARLPDLFILTDYEASEVFQYGYSTVPLENSFGALRTGALTGGDILFRDVNTTFTVKRCERLFLPALEARTDLISSAVPRWYGHGCYMTVEVNSHGSKRLGKWETHVIYLYAENTAFAKNILMQNQIDVDYILRVRYGAAFGGSRVDGNWLFCLSDLLNVKYYITREFNASGNWERDIPALDYLRGESEIRLEPAKLTFFYHRVWYAGEPVSWGRVVKKPSKA